MTDAHQLGMLAPPLTKADTPTSDDRCTPPNVLACVADFWPRGIGLDPCSNPWSLVKSRVRWDRSDDSLGFDWAPFVRDVATIWLNPPFSNPLPFVRRLVRTLREAPCEALLLVRHDSSTLWWKLIERHADALCLARERVHFRLAGEDTGAADHATTIVLFTALHAPHSPRKARGARIGAFHRAFDPLGLVCEVRR